eukprot:514183-Amphidinium_carterae.1
MYEKHHESTTDKIVWKIDRIRLRVCTHRNGKKIHAVCNSDTGSNNVSLDAKGFAHMRTQTSLIVGHL